MKWLQDTIKRWLRKIKPNKFILVSIAISIAILFRKLTTKSISTSQVKTIIQNISEFYDKLRMNQIKNVTILPNSIRYQDLTSNIFSALLPSQSKWLLQWQLIQNQINFKHMTISKSNNHNFFMVILLWSLVGFIVYNLFQLNTSSDMKTSDKPQKEITFKNIVGLQQCKQSLKEIIQFMNDPQKFMQIGARMRKGIIFYGPSGTGKTTLAKATAGQAGVPFFSCNASQFCQMYVGVGPKRVKQLFKRAKQSAPSIIYIDQIDAVGNRKQAGYSSQGASSEKNATINQLLSQMDGFASQQNVVVIGSTNRLEMIDQSLLRAGRFDLKIKIPLPDQEDRLNILKYHLESKKHHLSDQFLRNITDDLEDWSGADLENLANQAVYASLRRQSVEISQEILTSTARKLRLQMGH